MNFKVIQDGKEIVCNIILTFRDEINNNNYIVYTDGTEDEDGELEVYASRYILDNENYVLSEIESNYEWNLIDNMLEAKYKELD